MSRFLSGQHCQLHLTAVVSKVTDLSPVEIHRILVLMCSLVSVCEDVYSFACVTTQKCVTVESACTERALHPRACDVNHRVSQCLPPWQQIQTHLMINIRCVCIYRLGRLFYMTMTELISINVLSV